MLLKTERFGNLEVQDSEILTLTHELLGFPNHKQFCLVDPGDDTLILWLQSIDFPEIVFPIMEPQIFKPGFKVKLSPSEQKELKLENLDRYYVFCILTIPEKLALMTANMKAPLIVNSVQRLAKQVILQEQEHAIQHPMFKELKAHLITISQQKMRNPTPQRALIPIHDLPNPGTAVQISP